MSETTPTTDYVRPEDRDEWRADAQAEAARVSLAYRGQLHHVRMNRIVALCDALDAAQARIRELSGGVA